MQLHNRIVIMIPPFFFFFANRYYLRHLFYKSVGGVKVTVVDFKFQLFNHTLF